MPVRKITQWILFSVLLTSAGAGFADKAAAVKKPAGESKHGDRSDGKKVVVLWRDPTDIASRNLFYGPGGKAHEPHGPFVFLKEDLDGSNPKFSVRDSDEVKWKVKMGIEARPETAASRIIWAIGYYTNEDYFVRELHVESMPARLHRGQKLVGPGNSVHDVRLKREDVKKAGTWHWRNSPFTGTRELNGLRVAMAVINNWDLKDENNAIYEVHGEYIYVVSDLGASFGSSNLTWPLEKSRGNLDSYERSKFIAKVHDDSVDFRVPGRPKWVYWVNPKQYVGRVHLEWIGKDIPREDARWMGRLLARLSREQIRDAFRAAGFNPQDVEAYTSAMEERIQLLTDL